jgi:hypothetical protein
MCEIPVLRLKFFVVFSLSPRIQIIYYSQAKEDFSGESKREMSQLVMGEITSCDQYLDNSKFKSCVTHTHHKTSLIPDGADFFFSPFLRNTTLFALSQPDVKKCARPSK